MALNFLTLNETKTEVLGFGLNAALVDPFPETSSLRECELNVN